MTMRRDVTEADPETVVVADLTESAVRARLERASPPSCGSSTASPGAGVGPLVPTPGVAPGEGR